MLGGVVVYFVIFLMNIWEPKTIWVIFCVFCMDLMEQVNSHPSPIQGTSINNTSLVPLFDLYSASIFFSVSILYVSFVFLGLGLMRVGNMFRVYHLTMSTLLSKQKDNVHLI